MVLKLFVTVLELSLGALVLVFWASVGPETGGSELEAIKHTALDYAEGWYEGNAKRMERALHPDLAKRALMPDPRSGKGRIDHMSALALVQATRAGSGTRTPREIRRADVTLLDVYGNAASVKLVMHDWVDYLHLSKIDGRWVIVNVLWELTPEAKKRHGIPGEL
jgi:hypothetical protein